MLHAVIKYGSFIKVSWDLTETLKVNMFGKSSGTVACELSSTVYENIQNKKKVLKQQVTAETKKVRDVEKDNNNLNQSFDNALRKMVQ